MFPFPNPPPSEATNFHFREPSAHNNHYYPPIRGEKIPKGLPNESNSPWCSLHANKMTSVKLDSFKGKKKKSQNKQHALIKTRLLPGFVSSFRIPGGYLAHYPILQ